jgi:hypothetical protein
MLSENRLFNGFVNNKLNSKPNINYEQFNGVFSPSSIWMMRCCSCCVFFVFAVVVNLLSIHCGRLSFTVVFCVLFWLNVLLLCVMCITCLWCPCCTTATGLKPNCSQIYNNKNNIYESIITWCIKTCLCMFSSCADCGFVNCTKHNLKVSQLAIFAFLTHINISWEPCKTFYHTFI